MEKQTIIIKKLIGGNVRNKLMNQTMYVHNK